MHRTITIRTQVPQPILILSQIRDVAVAVDPNESIHNDYYYIKPVSRNIKPELTKYEQCVARFKQALKFPDRTNHFDALMTTSEINANLVNVLAHEISEAVQVPYATESEKPLFEKMLQKYIFIDQVYDPISESIFMDIKLHAMQAVLCCSDVCQSVYVKNLLNEHCDRRSTVDGCECVPFTIPSGCMGFPVSLQSRDDQLNMPVLLAYVVDNFARLLTSVVSVERTRLHLRRDLLMLDVHLSKTLVGGVFLDWRKFMRGFMKSR